MLKDRIIELRNQGKSYREIQNELNCSKGTISYYLGNNQKEKTLNRTKLRRKTLHPLEVKIENFLHRTHDKKIRTPSKRTVDKILYYKLQNFTRNKMKTITVEQLLEKIGPNPKCYLTGTPIDLSKSSTYQLDHIIPASRGGDNSIDNLGLCTKQVNIAKSNLTPEEFYDLCNKVVKHIGKDLHPDR